MSTIVMLALLYFLFLTPSPTLNHDHTGNRDSYDVVVVVFLGATFFLVVVYHHMLSLLIFNLIVGFSFQLSNMY